MKGIIVEQHVDLTPIMQVVGEIRDHHKDGTARSAAVRLLEAALEDDPRVLLRAHLDVMVGGTGEVAATLQALAVIGAQFVELVAKTMGVTVESLLGRIEVDTRSLS